MYQILALVACPTCMRRRGGRGSQMAGAGLSVYLFFAFAPTSGGFGGVLLLKAKVRLVDFEGVL